MKRAKLLIILIFLFNFQNLNADSHNNILFEKITKNLRCLICQGQSIYDSESDFSLSVKSLIKKKLIEGKTEFEIYDFLKNRYGEWIIYDPEFNKNTILLWIIPLILFIFGGVLVFRRTFIK